MKGFLFRRFSQQLAREHYWLYQIDYTAGSLGCSFHIQINLDSSVQFSHSVVSDSLQPHESQHTRPPYPSPTPGVHSDSRPLSPWCHPLISSSVITFTSCLQSLPASESFPVSQLITWGSQSTGASALASFLPKKSQGWSPPILKTHTTPSSGYTRSGCPEDGKWTCFPPLAISTDPFQFPD